MGAAGLWACTAAVEAPDHSGPATQDIRPTGQSAHILGGEPPVRYLLFRPAQYWDDPDRQWPLIVYLHGSADRGEDAELVRRDGVARFVETVDHFPFIVLSPQIPPVLDGDNLVEVFESYQQLLAQVVATHAVDTDRIYLTGLSLGGYLSWVWASLAPEQFAAVAPICAGGARGGGLTRERLCRLKDLPIWTFHGGNDPVVPAAATQDKVDILRACNGQVKFTLYPGAGHDVWTRAYHNPELFAWFLQHRRQR